MHSVQHLPCWKMSQVLPVTGIANLYHNGVWESERQGGWGRADGSSSHVHYPCPAHLTTVRRSSCLFWQESSLVRWVIKSASTDGAESAQFWYMPLSSPFSRRGGEPAINALQMAAVSTTSLTSIGEGRSGRRRVMKLGKKCAIAFAGMDVEDCTKW